MSGSTHIRERFWSGPPEHWYGSLWISVIVCVGELKRDGVGGKAPERQVCVGDYTKGRGERRRCQVVANITVWATVCPSIFKESNVSVFSCWAKLEGESVGLNCSITREQLHWFKWKRINCVGHTSENPWLVLVRIRRCCEEPYVCRVSRAEGCTAPGCTTRGGRGGGLAVAC